MKAWWTQNLSSIVAKYANQGGSIAPSIIDYYIIDTVTVPFLCNSVVSLVTQWYGYNFMIVLTTLQESLNENCRDFHETFGHAPVTTSMFVLATLQTWLNNEYCGVNMKILVIHRLWLLLLCLQHYKQGWMNIVWGCPWIESCESDNCEILTKKTNILLEF